MRCQKYKQVSYKRKPNPGMINDAIKDYNIDPQASIFIGDKLTDMVAATRAKVRCKLLLNDKTSKVKVTQFKQTYEECIKDIM